MSKKQKLILLTITLSLILLSVGLSFAFFSTINNNESSSTLYAKGGTMTIKYANGSGNIIVENIYPKKDAWVNKVFTVTGNNSTELDMDYRVYLVTKSNGFNYGDLTYSVSGTSTNSSDTLVQKANQNVPKSGEILIGKGTFKSKTATHSYNLRIFYKETGENQNNGQEKNYTGFVRIATGSTTGYNSLLNQTANTESNSTAFNGPIIKSEVESITFKTNTTVPSNAIASWDVSDKQNGSIMAYTLDTNNNNLYELYIGQDQKVVLGKDAKYLFANYNKSTTLDVSNLDTSNVTDMSHMFDGATVTSIIGLDKFDTSNVTKMEYVFRNTSNLTSLDLSKFNTSKVTSMIGMFERAKSLKTLDLSSFDTSNVTAMGTWNYAYGGMFQECTSLTSLNVSSFNTSNVTTMGNMFDGCTSLTNLDLSNFDTSKVEYMPSMFYQCKSLTTLNISSFNTSKVKYMNTMFQGVAVNQLDLSNFDTSNVLSMAGMFKDMKNITSFNISSFDTSKVTSMSQMFSGFNSTTGLDLSNFNTSKVTNMYNMFPWSNMPSLNLSSFDTSKVTNMHLMFGWSKIPTLDLSSFDTSNVTDMGSMFYSSSATIGYARTQADADRFNATDKPSGLTFKIKS